MTPSTGLLNTMKDWPPNWREAYRAFLACEDETLQQRMWESWEIDLRRHVNRVVRPLVRDKLKRWRAQTQEPYTQPVTTRRRTRSSEQRSATQPDPEVTSHNWLEGARIGEADNPGPQPTTKRVAPSWGNTRSRSRAPRMRSSKRQMPARRTTNYYYYYSIISTHQFQHHEQSTHRHAGQ